MPYRFRPDGARRAILLDGRAYGLDFQFDEYALRATLLAPAGEVGLGDGLTARLEALARHIWGLDTEPACLGKLQQDPHLRRVLEGHRGLTILRAAGLYEALLSIIIGQQVSVASANAIRRRLQAQLGEPCAWGEDLFFTPPRPERLLEAGAGALRDVGLSQQKARYLLAVARRTLDSDLEPESFTGLDDDEAIQRLMELPGVGRWTAENVLIRGLGRKDVLPAGDLGIRMAMQRLLGLPVRPTEAEVRKLGEAWAGCRSYATVYLWATLAAS